MSPTAAALWQVKDKLNQMKHGRQTRQQKTQADKKKEGQYCKKIKNKKKKPDFWARNTMGDWREGKGIRAGEYG